MKLETTVEQLKAMLEYRHVGGNDRMIRDVLRCHAFFHAMEILDKKLRCSIVRPSASEVPGIIRSSAQVIFDQLNNQKESAQ